MAIQEYHWLKKSIRLLSSPYDMVQFIQEILLLTLKKVNVINHQIRLFRHTLQRVGNVLRHYSLALRNTAD